MSNSTVVSSSEYNVPQYSSLQMPTGSNGGIYSAGIVTAQNSAANQNALINATKGGKKRYFKGGAELIAVPAVSVAYADGGQTQSLVANMTKLTATQTTNAKYDSGVTKGGRGKRDKRSRRCKRTCKKGCKSRKGSKSKRSKRSKRRISRRHM